MALSWSIMAVPEIIVMGWSSGGSYHGYAMYGLSIVRCTVYGLVAIGLDRKFANKSLIRVSQIFSMSYLNVDQT